MGRVVHFEITADDPKRAAEFYRQAFGWEIAGWGEQFTYLLATTGPEGGAGINGAITERMDHGQAVVNSIEVETWEAGAEAVKAAGGTVLGEKTPIPGMGYFAYCRDTEGNIFGIFQEDHAATMPVPAGAAEPAG